MGKNKRKPRACKMNIKTTKRQKVDMTISRQSLLSKLPDEMFLTILSYGEMEDIQNTRVWQSRRVQHWTETKSIWEASKNNNFDNLKWIYAFIGDTNFTHTLEDSNGSITVLNCTGTFQVFIN